MRGIVHARTNRKDDSFMQRPLYLYTGVWAKGLYIEEAHRRWTYSALWPFYTKEIKHITTSLGRGRSCNMSFEKLKHTN